MRRMALALVLLALAGCATPSGLDEMGCETAGKLLPRLDAHRSGTLNSEEAETLYKEANEKLRLGYFDDETASLLALLADGISDEYGEGTTPVDVDYSDMRSRLIDHCATIWPIEG